MGAAVTRGRVLTVVTAGALVLARDAVAAPTTRSAGASQWSAPANLADGSLAPEVAIDAAGRAYAAFVKGYPSNVQVAEGSAKTGVWSDPITLSPYPNTWGAHIAVNGRSDAVVGLSRNPGRHVPQVSYRSIASGSWRPAEDLPVSSPTFASAGEPVSAVDAAGNAVAVAGLASDPRPGASQ